MLQSLSPAADDVVYFTYSGHGTNSGDSRWPVFTFPFNSSDSFLTFDEVVSTLQPKPQRMLIVLADCCNVSLSASERLISAFEPSGQSALTTANLQRLFLDFRGTVLATAADVGQYSLGDGTEGGLFLNTFMDDFRTLADITPDLTWDIILAKTSTDAKDIAAYYVSTGGLGDIEPQQAQFTINTEQVAAATPASPASEPTSPSSTPSLTSPAVASPTSPSSTSPTVASPTSASPTSSPTESPSSTPAGSAEGNPSAAPACGAVGPLPLFWMMFGLCATLAGRKRNERL